jgi:hypothetical protein
MSLDWIPQVVTAVVSSGAIYAGIRADLRGLSQRVTRNERSTDRAHQRIDQHLNQGRMA